MSFVVHRVAKSAARYTDAGGREKCGYCRFFVAPRACGKVIGPVSPQGWCKYFSRQAVSLSGGGLAASAGGASFDQNFLGGSLGTGAVFTRASTGMYNNSAGTLVSAATDTPRFDYDPVTLQLKGLLLEDASTNLLLQSGNLANAAWQPAISGVGIVNPVVTANQTAAPDGTTTAASIAFSAVSVASTYCLLYQSFTATAAQYSFSIWLKGSVGGEQVYLAATLGATNAASVRLSLTTQWRRFTLITPPLTAASWAFVLGTDLRDATESATPAATVFAFGAQAEALGYPTSYIATTSAAASRSADVLRYPIASVTGFDPTKGSLALDYILAGARLGLNAPAQFVGASAVTDFIDVDEFAGTGAPSVPNLAGVVDLVGGSAVAYALYGALGVPANVLHKGAVSWAQGAAVLGAHDGVATTSSTGTATSLPVITNLTIAGPERGVVPLVSLWALGVQYWPRQLNQSELIARTA